MEKQWGTETVLYPDGWISGTQPWGVLYPDGWIGGDGP